MSDAIDAGNVGEYEHPEGVGSEQAVEENVEGSEEINPWDAKHLQDENGMVAGKYKNIDAMAKSLEHAEAKLSEYNAKEQSTNAKAANEAKSSETASNVAQAEQDLVSE